jgi:CDGSH-type Zn-finger protein
MPTKVTVRNDGPILIEGDFEIHDAQGGRYDLAGRTVIGLCRCGNSGNKPFCDGQHRVKGFESQCQAYQLAPPKPKV